MHEMEAMRVTDDLQLLPNILADTADCPARTIHMLRERLRNTADALNVIVLDIQNAIDAHKKRWFRHRRMFDCSDKLKRLKELKNAFDYYMQQYISLLPAFLDVRLS